METETQHTPGPWEVHEPLRSGSTGFYIRGSPDDGGPPVATVRGTKDATEDRANAQLIAAGPGMLEALREVAEEFMSARSYEQGLILYMDIGTVVRVREAIAKAEPNDG